jgi:galactose-1-phosphate uridylyltransferase
MDMFTVRKISVTNGVLQERTEWYTGLRCKISPERVKRHINQDIMSLPAASDCPFCPDLVEKVTPVFSNKRRVIRGESVTFPNLFPFAEWHTVTVITREHIISSFSRNQIADALSAQFDTLSKFDGYASINWNFLPSAGASLVHPHMQALSDRRSSPLANCYIDASRRYWNKYGRSYWDDIIAQEKNSERFLFGDEIFWHAHAVPVGEREVRGILPGAGIDEVASYTDRLAKDLLSIISLYQKLGTYAFNMSIFFGKSGNDREFSAFCSFISRINPNPNSISDSAFMERLHLEPVILTLPEDLGTYYRNNCL